MKKTKKKTKKIIKRDILPRKNIKENISLEITNSSIKNEIPLDEILKEIESSQIDAGLTKEMLHSTNKPDPLYDLANSFNDELYTMSYNDIVNQKSADDDIDTFKNNRDMDRQVLYSDVKKMLELDNEDSNLYSKRYLDSIKLILNTLEETDNYIDQSSEIINNLKKIRGKGASMTINEQAKIRSSLISNKLNIIKEYNSIKKNISDFELKRSKQTKDVENTQNNDIIVGDILSKILNSDITQNMKSELKDIDRREFTNIVGDTRQTDFLDNIYDKFKDPKTNSASMPESYSLSNFRQDLGFDSANTSNSMIHYDLNEFDNDTIQSESLNAFRHEQTGYSTAILFTDNKNWDFVALDSDGNILENMDLPNKKVTTVSFNHEVGKAQDNYGRVYELYYTNK